MPIQTIEISDGITAFSRGPQNSFWHKFAILAVIGDFFPYVIFPFLPIPLSITTAEFANVRGFESFFDPIPGGFEFRGAFGLPIPPTLIELEMNSDRDSVPILDIVWESAKRVFLLMEGSIEVMSIEGCFPRFFEEKEGFGLRLIGLRRIETEDIERFFVSGNFLFCVSGTELFKICEERGIERIDGIEGVVEGVGVSLSGEIVIARDGEISKCGNVDIRELAEVLRHRVLELRERREKLMERQKEIEIRVDRMEKVLEKLSEK